MQWSEVGYKALSIQYFIQSQKISEFNYIRYENNLRTKFSYSSARRYIISGSK